MVPLNAPGAKVNLGSRFVEKCKILKLALKLKVPASIEMILFSSIEIHLRCESNLICLGMAVSWLYDKNNFSRG